MTEPDEEYIVLLDDNANPIGIAPKLASHHANTPLHLAFSVYIFNEKGEVLVTQRALSKKVWPGVWTNSCCGHPMPDESFEAAIQRRVSYELGMRVKNLRCVLPDYRYKTPPFKGVIEHEVCPVYFATTTSPVKPNHAEVENFKWLSWEEFLSQTHDEAGEQWSWWCKDQLTQISQTLT